MIFCPHWREEGGKYCVIDSAHACLLWPVGLLSSTNMMSGQVLSTIHRFANFHTIAHPIFFLGVTVMDETFAPFTLCFIYLITN